MNKPNLSIVAVSYNNEKQLPKCLDSIFTETKTIPTQLIVVDNASSDNSVKVLRGSITSITGTTSTTSKINVEVIENKENLGYSKAVNQGFRQASGESILLLNADTILIKDCIKTLLDFERRHKPVMVGPQLLNLDGTIQPSVFRLPTVVGAIREFWLGVNNAYLKYTPPGNQPVMVEAVVGGAMLISKKIIDKVGGFDEKYFMYFEDLDYCRKVSKAGFPIYYLPEAKITHEHGASGKALADPDNQWRRLIPSSKIYHGIFKNYLISLIIRLGQKLKNVH